MNITRPFRWTMLLVVPTLALAACGSGTNDSAPTKRPEAATVTIKGFTFAPKRLEIKAGTAVTWTNQDMILHTATAGNGPDAKTDTFDGTMDAAGKSFSFTFAKAGTYSYFCSRHPEVPSMHGEVVVS